MKTIMNIEELLDVLGDTGIIVVRQQDHKILYANKKATQMNSELVKNMIFMVFGNNSVKIVQQKI